jgi:hypothetical protein
VTTFGLDGDGATESLGDHHLFARSERHFLAAGDQRDFAVLSEFDRCVSRCAHTRLLPGPRGIVVVEGAPRCVPASVAYLTHMGNSEIGGSAASEPRRAQVDLAVGSLGQDAMGVSEKGEGCLTALAGKDCGEQRSAGLRDGPSRTLEGDAIDATVGEFQMAGERVGAQRVDSLRCTCCILEFAEVVGMATVVDDHLLVHAGQVATHRSVSPVPSPSVESRLATRVSTWVRNDSDGIKSSISRAKA